jgi:hypothetical protein
MTWRLVAVGILGSLATLAEPRSMEVPPLVGGTGPASPQDAAVIADTLVVAGLEGEVVKIDLQSGERTTLPLPEPVASVTHAGEGKILAVSKSGASVTVLDSQGKVAAAHRLVVRIRSACTLGGELVAAQMLAKKAGQPLLWRGILPELRRWSLPAPAVPVEGVAADLAWTTALACDDTTAAVVWWFFHSEVVLLNADGRTRVVPLPAFGAAGASQSHLGEDWTQWPKAYFDVAVGGGRVWCLTFNEGPWHGDPQQRRRGRHLVEVAMDGSVVATHSLPADMFQVAYDGPRHRLLLLDRQGAVWVARKTTSPGVP